MGALLHGRAVDLSGVLHGYDDPWSWMVGPRVSAPMGTVRNCLTGLRFGPVHGDAEQAVFGAQTLPSVAIEQCS